MGPKPQLPTPPLEPPRSKKVLQVLGALLAVAILYICYRLMPLIFLLTIFLTYGSIDSIEYNSASTQANAVPTVTLATHPCGTSTYAWIVIEKSVAVAGNRLELGTGAHIEKQRFANLVDTTTGNTITTLEYGLGYAYNLPAGGPFVHVYIINFPLAGLNNHYTLDTVIPNTAMDEKTFDTVARCLAVNAPAIKTTVDSRNDIVVGWIALTDASLAQDETHTVTYFTCTDQHGLSVNDNVNDQRVGGPGLIGEIGIDGKTAFFHGATLPSGCKNSEGVSLDDFLTSIPQRISVLTL